MFSNIVVIVVVALIILVVVAWVTQRLRKLREDAFTQFARRYGLEIIDADETPRVSGVYRNRQFLMEASDEGSDDEAGILEVSLALGLKNAPDEMLAEATVGVIGDVVQLADGRDVMNATSQFERDVLVKPAHNAYWTEQRQKIFLDFMNSTDCDPVRIRNGFLEVEFRSVVTTLEHLEKIAEQVCAVAEDLDSASSE